MTTPPAAATTSPSTSIPTITTIAGIGTAGDSGDNDLATSAQLNYPIGVAVDSVGSLYIADSSNHRVRKVTAGGITTVAGTGAAGDSGDNDLATSAQLNNPQGVAVDSVGSLYIADSSNHRVRKVTGGGITTVAGTGAAGDSGDNGLATSAQLNYPIGVAVDSAGSLYIAEWSNHRVRKVTAGRITTVAGTGAAGDSGDNGPATSAQLNNPQGLAVDSAGSLYITDSSNHRVRKVTAGRITTVAGTGAAGDSGDKGPATSAQLDNPTGVVVDSAGSLYIADCNNHRVRKVTGDGVITTVAGTGTAEDSGDKGPATSAQLNYPIGVAVDSAGSLYISEWSNHRVRKVVGVVAKNPTAASLRGGATVFVPAQETKIMSVFSKKPLSAQGQSHDDGALIIQDSSDSGMSHQGWRLVLVKGENDQAGKKIDEDEYRIENVSSGKVLDAKDGAKGTPIVQNSDSGGANQRWRIIPIEGETNQHIIESVSSGSVLGLANFSKDDGTQIILHKYHGGTSQRWQFMPPRRADRKLQWTPWSHWDGRQRWQLVSSSTLQPKPDAKPTFSDMKLVLTEFGYNKEAGEWLVDTVLKDFTYNQGWTGEDRPRFFVDTTDEGRVDIVAFDHGGVTVARGRGDGTFEEAKLVIPDFGTQQGWTSEMPRFLVDITGDGRVDIVGCFDDGVWVSRQDDTNKFARRGNEPVVKAFGYNDGWRVEKHPRFFVDTTGEGRVDIVGCFDDGVWVSRQDDTNKFARRGNEPVVKAFGYNDGWRVEKHPRFFVDTTGEGRVDIVGCFDDGVWVSRQDDTNKFAPARLVHKNFGSKQGWTSVKEHPRFLVKTTGDGQGADIIGFGPDAVVVTRRATTTGDGQGDTTGEGRVDIVGFGPEGVWVARGDGDGGFADSTCVLEDFGSNQGWTGETHLRFLADTTGDGQVDIVGFGDEGVWVSRGQGSGEFAQAELVCRGFGYNKEAGGWRVDRHPRFLVDTTGDGRMDIVGFGGPGVYVARNLARQFVTC